VTESQRPIVDEPPPFFGRWPRLYLFVCIYLAVVIALFYWFTKSFAP